MELVNKRKCTGCSACANVCPKNCISMVDSDFGDLYPQIDNEKCVDCGACNKACPEINPLDYKAIQNAYAVWSLVPENRSSSASGGAAAEFYAQALENDYYICGVEYADDFHVVHTLKKDESAISKYKQSKYVFSEIGDIYQQIKSKLVADEKVLFISLPCKVAGLKGYLQKEYDNLISVDIVCHGTPSHKLLSNHINAVDKNNESSILRFRYDNQFVFDLSNENKLVYKKIGKTDNYLAAFLEGLSYRDNCYSCSYARPDRISDITICDFWGLGAEIPFDHPYTGSISAVLVNTDKGADFFGKSKHRFFVEERPVEEAVKGNAQLNSPTPLHKKRKEFEKLYVEQGFEKAVEICLADVISAEKEVLKKQKMRSDLRKLAGVFIKKYRG